MGSYLGSSEVLRSWCSRCARAAGPGGRRSSAVYLRYSIVAPQDLQRGGELLSKYQQDERAKSMLK